MMSWLIPRLGVFHDQHPDIELRFNTNYDRIDFVRDEISVAIRNSMIEPPKEVIIKDMVDEWIGPVCSSEYATKHFTASDKLDRCILLASKTRPGGWADWVKMSGQSRELRAQKSYDHFYLLIQAAACGLGVAMVPKILVLDDLRSGKLVAPLGFVAGPFKIVLWIAPHLRARHETKALVDWLTREFRRPGMQGDAVERATVLPLRAALAR